MMSFYKERGNAVLADGHNKIYKILMVMFVIAFYLQSCNIKSTEPEPASPQITGNIIFLNMDENSTLRYEDGINIKVIGFKKFPPEGLNDIIQSDTIATNNDTSYYTMPASIMTYSGV